MKNILYLIGAGASANALPLIKKSATNKKSNLPHELKLFVHSYSNSSYVKTVLLTQLHDIADKSIEFGTPDLYAKYLLEKGDESNYKLLKKLLSNYFEYKQEIVFTGTTVNNQGCFDFRALTFLTTISQEKKIPTHIKMLSWNYDRQIELAAGKLRPVSQGGYNMVQGFNCWPNCQEGQDGHSFTGIPFLFHLNGVAGYNYSPRDFAEKSADIYNFDITKETLLSFAWENQSNDNKNTFHNSRLEMARKIADQTEILVVIGYSFPFFNRKIDEEIFAAMSPSLKKIYFQDPEPDNNGQQLFTKFELSNVHTSNIIHVKDVENYHVPYEL